MEGGGAGDPNADAWAVDAQLDEDERQLDVEALANLALRGAAGGRLSAGRAGAGAGAGAGV